MTGSGVSSVELPMFAMTLMTTLILVKVVQVIKTMVMLLRTMSISTPWKITMMTATSGDDDTNHDGNNRCLYREGRKSARVSR